MQVCYDIELLERQDVTMIRPYRLMSGLKHIPPLGYKTRQKHLYASYQAPWPYGETNNNQLVRASWATASSQYYAATLVFHMPSAAHLWRNFL